MSERENEVLSQGGDAARLEKPTSQPRRLSPLRWAPGLAGLSGLGVLLAGTQTVALPRMSAAIGPAPEDPSLTASANQLPTEPFLTPEPEETTPGLLDELMARAETTPASDPAVSGPGILAASSGSLAGRIGPIGPLLGPANIDLSGTGPVRGPIWNGKPLPRAGAFGILPSLTGDSESPEVATAPTGPEASSELPDAGKLALSRLANPQLTTVRTAPGAQPEKAVEITAEKPLILGLSVGRPVKGYEPGATVAVRLSANAEAYFVLIGVDAEGNASTIYRSSSPARSFAYGMRAQSGAGPQYLVALASVNPPSGADAASALRAYGQGFIAPVMTIANNAAQPGAAWGAAVSTASSLGGGSKGWKRYEWAVSAASFATHAPTKVAVKPQTDKPTTDKPGTGKPGSGEVSVMPQAPSNGKGDKSLLPTAPKGDTGQPKSPMAIPEPAKAPTPKAEGGASSELPGE